MTISTRQDLKARFTQFAKQWKSESRHIANADQMAMFQSYKNIISMGDPVIPLILEELRREPDHWFWALEAITLENPVPEEAMGNIEAMARAWIQWGIKMGYISSRVQVQKSRD
jgi:hypothetical protein